MDQENNQESEGHVERLVEKTRSLSKRLSELERNSRFGSDLEVRIKVLEVESERISAQISEMDRNIKKLELNHDNRKERWNMAVNFVVQLAWVSMAAFLLSKLGLQAPL